MKLYISGPITGLEDGNKDAFETAERVLREAGFETFNPHALRLPIETPWQVCMKACLKEMMDCQGVALLEGWARSDGALLERLVANNLFMPTWRVDEWVSGRTPGVGRG